MKRLYGLYEIAPHIDDPNTYDLKRDYAFLRQDGLLIISAKGTHVNGASIPLVFWPFLGSPLSGTNKLWSCCHDSLYAKTAIVIDTNTLKHITIQEAFDNWRDIPSEHFIHQTSFRRKFADQTLLEAMRYLGVNLIKRRLVYRAVRIFGRAHWTQRTVRAD